MRPRLDLLAWLMLLGAAAALLAFGWICVCSGRAHGATASAPYVVRDATGPDSCANTCDEPCPGRVLTLANPGRRAVVAAVRCAGDPRTDLEVRVPARGRARLEVGVGRPLAAGECVLFRFWYPTTKELQ